MDVFNKLIQIRKEKKITQTKLASNLGVSKVMLSRYESGSTRIRFEEVLKYADALGYELRLMVK